MAKVKNQSIPTDQFEETLDPPIDFRDQYLRALSEGIDHPKLPAGEEIVTFSKKESRPAQRSENPYYDKPLQQDSRDGFSECVDCWKTQYRTEADLDECHSAGSKHYVTPWKYIPGAKNTYFIQFMSDCLKWAIAHPDIKFPKCEDLVVLPDPSTYCPADESEINIYKGIPPLTVNASAGTVDESLIWHAPPELENCPDVVTITVSDSEGRNGCAEITRTPQEECCDCETLEPIKIAWTSQYMLLGEQQTLSIDPTRQGCPPYTWTLLGIGSLEPAEDNLTALYTAPDTNPGCMMTCIQLRDACDSIYELQIGIEEPVGTYYFDWKFEETIECQGNTGNRYAVYSISYNCVGGSMAECLIGHFTVFGPIPTAWYEIFCAAEAAPIFANQGDSCYDECGLETWTYFVHGTYISGC